MIKKLSMNRICKMTLFVFIFFLLYLFPNNKEYELKTNIVNKQYNYHDIYLIDKNNYVSKTNIIVNSIEKEKLAKDLLDSLTIDSKNSIKVPNNFKAVIPKKTKILNIKVENETIRVTFSNEITNTNNKDQMIECIVYTLTSINNIKRVILSVENDNEYFKNEYTRNIGINKKYDITNLNDILSVTIYYLSKENDVDYYIPVTKYMNSKDNKIKVIIDELASKSTLESNLMSYLNYETKLINYEIKDDDIYLYFNESILNSSNDNKILEEVIYTISYSVKDSIEVNNIHFIVNDKEI